MKLQPRNVMAWHLLGQSLEHESQTQAAIAAWRQAVAIDPDYSQALWSLARAIKPADPDEAARLMARYARCKRSAASWTRPALWPTTPRGQRGA